MFYLAHSMPYIWWNKVYIWWGLSIKERRLYRRIHFAEKVKFGYDKPKYNGISTDLSPEGMSIISDKTLVPESNIIINIYVKKIIDINVKKIKVDHTEKLEIITVEGEVIWGKHFPDAPSKMGIKFKESNKELVRIYAANIPSAN